jgi:hypothetical protein
MRKNKRATSREARLSIKVQDEDWILIEGCPEGLTELATQILLVAKNPGQSLTMDHPGPKLTPDSHHGLYVWRRP